MLYLVKWKDLSYDKSTWEVIDDSPHLRGGAVAVKHYEEMK